MNSRRVLWCAGSLISFLTLALVAYAQNEAVVFNGSWPLLDLALKLEDRYARPVTFEAAPLKWRGHMQRIAVRSDGTEILTFLSHSLSVPSSLGLLSAPSIGAELVKAAVETYHGTPGFPRYRVLQSEMGLHIVPVQAMDENGILRSANSVLDSPIEVLMEARTPSEHLDALLAAVSNATGVLTTSMNPIDRPYAPNGYFVQGTKASQAERAYARFTWGVSEMTGRDALIDLLSRSQTTMTWKMICRPDFFRGNQQICVVGVAPLVVDKKILAFDRCTKCRSMPSQRVGILPRR